VARRRATSPRSSAGPGWACEDVGDGVACELETLAPRTSAVLALDVSVTTLAGEVGLDVAAGGVTGTSASTRVRELRAELGLGSGPPSPWATGVIFGEFGYLGSFSFEVMNTGTTKTRDLTVTATLPPGLYRTGGAGDQWSCQGGGFLQTRNVTCTSSAGVEPGAPVAVSLQVFSLRGDGHSLTATASASNARQVASATAALLAV